MMHFRENGRELGIFHVLISLGHLKRAQGKMVDAIAHYREALSIQQKTRYIHYVAQILEGLAHIAVVGKNMEVAVQFFGMAQARRDSVEMTRWAHHETEFQIAINLTKNQLSTNEWRAAWDCGYNMASQDALEYALSEEIQI